MFPKQAELANVVEEIKKNILIINGLIMKVRIKNPICGVPISFLDKYCPNQFRILDARDIALNDKQRNKSTYLIKDADGTINGKTTYARILIQKIN